MALESCHNGNDAQQVGNQQPVTWNDSVGVSLDTSSTRAWAEPGRNPLQKPTKHSEGHPCRKACSYNKSRLREVSKLAFIRPGPPWLQVRSKLKN